MAKKPSRKIKALNVRGKVVVITTPNPGDLDLHAVQTMHEEMKKAGAVALLVCPTDTKVLAEDIDTAIQKLRQLKRGKK